jgi:hypothetical protein
LRAFVTAAPGVAAAWMMGAVVAAARRPMKERRSKAVLQCVRAGLGAALLAK